MLFTTYTVKKLEGIEPWIHIPQLKKVPHDIWFFANAAAAAAKLLQSCPTLCVPIDGSPAGSLSLGFSR